MNILEQLDLTEESCYFKASALAEKDLSKIERSGIDLKENENFEHSKFKSFFDRKNIVYYGKIVCEAPMQIKKATGEFSLPLIDVEELTKTYNSIKPEKRKLISYVHLSTIQILVKSTFLKGINSPISLALTDERILCQNDKLIGITHGNLATVTVKFNSCLGYAIPLREASLNNSLSLAYKFHRQDLMRENDEPFSITYAVNYALTNSHHSIHFARKDRIYLDELFKKVSICETPKFLPIVESKTLAIAKEDDSQRFSVSKSFREIRPNLKLEAPPMSKNSDKTEGSSKDEIENLTDTVKNLSTYLKHKI